MESVPAYGRVLHKLLEHDRRQCPLPLSQRISQQSLPRHGVSHNHLQSYLVEFMWCQCFAGEGDVFLTFLSHVAEVSLHY